MESMNDKHKPKRNDLFFTSKMKWNTSEYLTNAVLKFLSTIPRRGMKNASVNIVRLDDEITSEVNEKTFQHKRTFWNIHLLSHHQSSVGYTLLIYIKCIFFDINECVDLSRCMIFARRTNDKSLFTNTHVRSHLLHSVCHKIIKLFFFSRIFEMYASRKWLSGWRSEREKKTHSPQRKV